MIEELQKEELSRDLGRAGLETLTIILYKGPISRREIDYIRGVNSGFILRNLLIRGLIERAESQTGERSFSYKPTLALLEYLGISKRDDLPEYEVAFKKLEEFSKTREDEELHEKS
jgi:segregation and condensation protein B